MIESSIIVIAYHGDSWMPECINSIRPFLKPVRQLLLLDNTGNKNFDQLFLNGINSLVLRTSRPMGFAEANNFALLKAKQLGKFVVFLNQDTRTNSDWLRACIECLEINPAVAAVTPLTRTYDWNDWDWNFLECAKKSEQFASDLDGGGKLKPFYEVPVIPAAAMVVRRSILEHVGPFDPIYGSYYEDYDLCHRIRSAGFKVGICTGGAIAHFSGSVSRNEGAERRRVRWVTRNRVIYGQRITEKGRLWNLLQHLFLTFPRGITRSLLRRPAAKPLMPYLYAHVDLISLVPRLISTKHDHSCWKSYLKNIGWPRSEKTVDGNYMP